MLLDGDGVIVDARCLRACSVWSELKEIKRDLRGLNPLQVKYPESNIIFPNLLGEGIKTKHGLREGECVGREVKLNSLAMMIGTRLIIGHSSSDYDEPLSGGSWFRFIQLGVGLMGARGMGHRWRIGGCFTS